MGNRGKGCFKVLTPGGLLESQEDLTGSPPALPRQPLGWGMSVCTVAPQGQGVPAQPQRSVVSQRVAAAAAAAAASWVPWRPSNGGAVLRRLGMSRGGGEGRGWEEKGTPSH